MDFIYTMIGAIFLALMSIIGFVCILLYALVVLIFTISPYIVILGILGFLVSILL